MTFLPPVAPSQPTLDGFTTYFYAATAIPQTVIPTTSLFLGYAYNVALSTVNLKLNAAGGPIYMLAVYDLATDNLINWAPPSNPPVYFMLPSGAQVLDAQGNPIEYMTYLRQQYGINQFTPGVISSSGDESTNASYEMLEQYKGYTLANLQNLKTPWGRAYLSKAADVGNLWGLS